MKTSTRKKASTHKKTMTQHEDGRKRIIATAESPIKTRIGVIHGRAAYMRRKIYATRVISLCVLCIICALCILPRPITASALEWSEILFNPVGNDNNKEFVELIGAIPLEDCVIHDSASSDRLVLLHGGNAGNEQILILENESIYLSNNAVLEATVYVVGSAIGNGLGNTYETLSIVCGNNSTIISTSYNTSQIEGFEEGRSIIYDSAEWKTGSPNGTPGLENIALNSTNSTINTSSDTNTSGVNGTTTNTTNGTASNSTTPLGGAAAEQGNDARGTARCNESLQLFVRQTKTTIGAIVEFSIISPAYADFDARDANGKIVAAGDNLLGNDHSLIVPNTTIVRIVASSDFCGARQRMTRQITVQQPPLNATITNDTTVNLSDRPPSPALASSPLLPLTPRMMEEDPAQTDMASTVQPDHPATIMPSGAVVIDQGADALPWISVFGAITIIVSAIVFLHVLRDGKRTECQTKNEHETKQGQKTEQEHNMEHGKRTEQEHKTKQGRP